jgi:hypothetical protein
VPSCGGEIMQHMPMTEDEVDVECASALADAGLPAKRVRFYRLAELGQGHLGAGWFRPHQTIYHADPAFPDDAQRAVANQPGNRELHRLTIPAAPGDRATFAALVRHELEHARQYDALGAQICDMHDFVLDRVLREVAVGLHGCGGLINQIPTEGDCNAAASVYVASRFTEEEVQKIRDGQRWHLVCSLIPPSPPETLPARMVAFAFVYREAVERHAKRRNFSAASILGSVHGYAEALWSRLEEGLRPST